MITLAGLVGGRKWRSSLTETSISRSALEGYSMLVALQLAGNDRKR